MTERKIWLSNLEESNRISVKMKLDDRMQTFLLKIVQFGIVLVTALAFVKGIFVSLDIDESYAVAQSYRLATGDRLLVDMWEPHQLSAFMSAIFIKAYLVIFQTTDYLVIYLRIVGMLIHAGLGVWLYRCLREKFPGIITFAVTMLHMNFFPKWVQMPEFELMHYWFMLTGFLLLYPYFEGDKYSRRRPFLAGVCLVGCMMSYPTMLLLYPVYIIGLAVLEGLIKGRKGKAGLRSGLWLTLGALSSGGGFLVYLFSYQTGEEFFKNLRKEAKD